MADKAPVTFTMTADHLARNNEAVRLKERRKVAGQIQDRADIEIAAGRLDLGQALQELAEGIRPGVKPVGAPQPDPVLDTVEERAGDPSGDGGLPPVRHRSDEEEGDAMVKQLTKHRR